MSYKVTGYDPNEYFFASRYKQGGRTVYSLDFSVRELTTFLPKPDPETPLDANSTQRRIVPGHARDFGSYVVENVDWVSPALLLRAPNIFDFEPIKELETGTTQFGTLGVPKDSKAEISIVDGQHRTLGFHLAWEQVNREVSEARATAARAKDQGELALVTTTQKNLEVLTEGRDRLARERVSVQIVLVDTPEVARQIFVDINDNAKGITGAVKSRFDDRKVVTRTLNKVLTSNTLLRGRVDLEQDRVTGSSKFLLGAKHVADIIRALAVGNGRVGKRVEDELNESDLASEFDDFTESLLEAFPELSDIENDESTPAELRRSSLIGSSVLLRSMGAAWYELRRADRTAEQITKAFSEFAPHMSLPVYPSRDDSWYATGVFLPQPDGAFSSQSRAQDFRALTDFIVSAANGKVRWKRAMKPDEALLTA